ncbi:hypothetical protein M408DRAFT_14022 [Serendipita vermifera MAFF 305830]|uniref:DNA polymerase delta subunit 3 n=1 Tax=Serendipita vermifera MAFF 305830 TaxID=933852 RepID=A0A0C2X4X6_SERVB|nr:hypothetical protein M408DRAFT_14022 [Serendipita vermifera MAFF 305830]
MSELAIHDYLTKQIVVKHNIITFRLLSRAVSIHVNAAKSALATFYDANKSSSGSALHATYLISGLVADTVKKDDSMDVDGVDVDAPSPMAEAVTKQKMMVVPEEKLEGINQDPSLLVTTVEAVRKVDATKTADDLRKLGIPIGSACKYNASIKGKTKAPVQAQPTASTSKQAATATKEVNAKVKPEKVKQEPKPEPTLKKEVPKTTLAKKPSTTVQTGGLDWGKAKPKATAKAAPEKPKPAEKGAIQRAPSVSLSATSDPKPKRGIKRPTPPSGDEDEEDLKPPKAKARMSAPSKATTVRAKNGVLLSDDEDEDGPPVKAVRRKTKNDNVVAAPRHVPGPPSTKGGTTENDEEEEDEPEQSSLGEDAMEMSDGVEEPKYAKVNRAKKSKWPLGANGLRKKRIVKTREFTDKRGFLQMEDYSEYESVNSESEQPPDPAAKGKKATKEVKVKPEPVEQEIPKLAKQSSFKESAPAKPKPKPKQSATGGTTKKKTLDSFFAKK